MMEGPNQLSIKFTKMNQLSREKRRMIIHQLVEGGSLRSTSRLIGCSINTVTKLLVEIGTACANYHDRAVRNLNSTRIECDEIWSYVYAKEKNVPPSRNKWSDGAGDFWTWVAFDPDSKLVVTWLVGTRDFSTGYPFMQDLAGRLSNRIQLSTDGLNTYLSAVKLTFGEDIDYGRIVKIIQSAEDPETQLKAMKCTGKEMEVVTGNPDPDLISTSLVERQNLTMRTSLRRFTRLTNGFSKKLENHCHALALHYMYYNFCRIHSTIRVTPAMEAGLTKDVWEIEDLLDLIKR